MNTSTQFLKETRSKLKLYDICRKFGSWSLYCSRIYLLFCFCWLLQCFETCWVLLGRPVYSSYHFGLGKLENACLHLLKQGHFASLYRSKRLCNTLCDRFISLISVALSETPAVSRHSPTSIPAISLLADKYSHHLWSLQCPIPDQEIGQHLVRNFPPSRSSQPHCHSNFIADLIRHATMLCVHILSPLFPSSILSTLCSPLVLFVLNNVSAEESLFFFAFLSSLIGLHMKNTTCVLRILHRQ